MTSTKPTTLASFRGANGVAHLWDLFRNGRVFEESEERQISSTLIPELNRATHNRLQATWLLRKRMRDLHHFSELDIQEWGNHFREIHTVSAELGAVGRHACARGCMRLSVSAPPRHAEP
jgi:hypothetical protein